MDILESLNKNIRQYICEKLELEETYPEFRQLLDDIHLDYDMYLNAIRYELKQPKVFLKRGFNALKLNAFNTDVLRLHQANMDIQFILKAYSIAHYILDYINMSQRGMSKLLRDAIKDINDDNHSIRERLKTICKKFLNATEVSAQEAVYHILGIKVSQSSRSTIFINTGEPDQRTKIVKSKRELKLLPNDSNDIYTTGLLDYYVNRPDCLEDLNLADFASKFDYSKKKPNKRTKFNDEQTEEYKEYEFRTEDSLTIKSKYELK